MSPAQQRPLTAPVNGSALRPRMIIPLVFAGLLLTSTLPGKPESRARPASPLQFHRLLRDRLRHHQNSRALVLMRVRQSRDHSFDAFGQVDWQRIESLKLEEKGLQAWNGRHYHQALGIYRRAFQLLSRDGATSEVCFCLYYIAEIYSEQDRYAESLKWINRALSLSHSRKRTYFEALAYESRGYSLWFLDHLQESARAFGRALKRWKELRFHSGIVISWNNLAALYEELGLENRADSCYRQACRQLTGGSGVASRQQEGPASDPDGCPSCPVSAGASGGPSQKDQDASIDPEISFQVYSNYAGFLQRRGSHRRALLAFSRARAFRELDPASFLLLRCRILGRRQDWEELNSARDLSPSEQIERLLLLGSHFQHTKQLHRAEDSLRRALDQSRRLKLRLYLRKSALRLGSMLEAEGREGEAGRLYFGVFRNLENLRVPEYLFPYSRSVSPLFDGWIRSLVESGRQSTAWQGIQRLMTIRRLKAKNFQEAVPFPRGADELSQLLAAAQIERAAPVSNPWKGRVRARAGGNPFDPARRFLKRAGLSQACLIEMWPDGKSVFAWVIDGTDMHFHRLVLPQSAAALIDGVMGPLYSSRRVLPPAPPSFQLTRLYHYLFQPLEAELQSRSLLVIAHKELQRLPLGILEDREGHFLAEKYSFSYLPSLKEPPQEDLEARKSRPFVALSRTLSNSPQLEREIFFFRHAFPEARLSRSFTFPSRLRARWIHLSGHFRLDDRFWLTSAFTTLSGRLNVVRFLHDRFSTALLSLGVCDFGNAQSSESPYWLGFSELLLQSGARSLVVNRWRMDESASRIFRGFFSYLKQGLTIDEALSRAQRDFMSTTVQRAGYRAHGANPFFWGGLTYVGLPGIRLYERPGAGSDLRLLTFSLGLILVFTLGLLVRRPAGNSRLHLQPRRSGTPGFHSLGEGAAGGNLRRR